jgi:hypothetical protein
LLASIYLHFENTAWVQWMTLQAAAYFVSAVFSFVTCYEMTAGANVIKYFYHFTR